jgi:hypothetical protein
MRNKFRPQKASFLSLKFFEKFVSVEEACDILAIVHDKPLKDFTKLKVSDIQIGLDSLKEDKKMTANKMLMIESFIERQDEKYYLGFVRRVIGRFISKIY